MSDSPCAPRWRRRCTWLVFLIAAGHAAPALADPVYRCVDAQGAVTFQDRACADTAEQSVVTLPPAPKPASSPDYGVERRPASARASGAASSRAASKESAKGGAAYECRAADGRVFYRHNLCPRSIPALGQDGTAARGRGAAKSSVAVTATRISREEACYELRRAGAAGRSGHEHDQDVSTYDKNLGRDLCR